MHSSTTEKHVISIGWKLALVPVLQPVVGDWDWKSRFFLHYLNRDTTINSWLINVQNGTTTMLVYNKSNNS